MSERDAIVEVTEADRQCASDIIALIAGGDDQAWALVHSIKRGQSDNINIVQRVARHRATHAGEVERLREALQNMMGIFDNAVYRRRLANDSLYQEAIKIARQALKASR